MADDVALPAASGNVAADERTINSVTVKVQRVVGIGLTDSDSVKVTPTTTAATLIAARETRSGVLIINNTDKFVHLGKATVTTSKAGLAPGAAMFYPVTHLIQHIIAAGTATGTVDAFEFFD